MRVWSVFLSLLVLSCAPPVPPPTPSSVPDGQVRWSSIAVGVEGQQVRVRGFSNAVPPGSEVQVSANDRVLGQCTSDPQGRFDLRVASSDSVELLVRGGALLVEERLSFTVRDMQQARADAVNKRLSQAGAVPNALSFAPAFGQHDDAVLLMVSSGDNLIDNIGIRSGQRRFEPVQLAERTFLGRTTSANPFYLVALGARAAVTHFGHPGLSLFDVATGRFVDQVFPDTVVELDDPFDVPLAVDSDGDGHNETQLTRVLPRGFEGVVASGQRLFVFASNVLHMTPPAVYAPGMVLVYDVIGGQLLAASPPVLHASDLNPQGGVVHEGRLFVINSGVIEQTATEWIAGSSGSIDVFATDSLQHLARVDLGLSAPGPAAISADGNSVYVGSLLKAELYKIDINNLTVTRGLSDPIVLFASDEVQSVFAVLSHPSGLLFVSSFNTDQVIVVDSVEDRVNPWPFDEPFLVGDGGQAFGGAQDMSLRAGRNGVDFVGPDLAVLMGLSSRVATIDTRHVMGP